MKLLPVNLSLRTRLLLAGVLVNVMMLALLIADGISVMDNKLDERARGVFLPRGAVEETRDLNAVDHKAIVVHASNNTTESRRAQCRIH